MTNSMINNDLVTKHFKHKRKYDDILVINIEILCNCYMRSKNDCFLELCHACHTHLVLILPPASTK